MSLKDRFCPVRFSVSRKLRNEDRRKRALRDRTGCACGNSEHGRQPCRLQLAPGGRRAGVVGGPCGQYREPTCRLANGGKRSFAEAGCCAAIVRRTVLGSRPSELSGSSEPGTGPVDRG